MEICNLLMLDRTFTTVWVFSRFHSVLWVERYYEYGTVQMELPWEPEVYAALKVGYFLYLTGSTDLMIIETINLVDDKTDEGKRKITVKGVSMIQLLERRVYNEYDWTITNQSLGGFIRDMVHKTIVAPTDPDRKIDFVQIAYGGDVYLNNTKISGAGNCDNVYDLAHELCYSYEIGMKMVYNEALYGENRVVFMLYRGVDRSYDQWDYPPVIFSSRFENIVSIRYSFDVSKYKTMCYVWKKVEIETTDPVTGATSTRIEWMKAEVGIRNVKGMDRRETSAEADGERPADLYATGLETLAKVNVIEAADCELDNERKQFTYGKDFFMGDIVQVITDFGLDEKARVIEFARSWDENGYTENPGFEILNNEGAIT